MSARLLACAALLLAGCSTPGYLRADAVDYTLRGVVARHAAYTEADETLTDLQRRTNLRDGALLVKLLDTAQATEE